MTKYKDEIISITYPSDSIRIESQYASSGMATPDNYNLYLLYNDSNKKKYIDLHAPRPYTTFGKSIEKIIAHYE